MALQLLVNSVDLTEQIRFPSLTKRENLTKAPDELNFEIWETPSKTIPVLGDEVELYDGMTKIFGGIITEQNSNLEGGAIISRVYGCKDYTQTLDRQLVVRSYENESITDIITDIIGDFTTGFTTTNVEAGLPVIGSVRFNYEQPSKCLEKLANLINYDWYVDYDKDVHFFKAEANPAPFNLSETDDYFIYDSLNFSKNIYELKNEVIVRGGEYKTTILEADAVDKYNADGDQRVFNMLYRYDNIKIRVDGGSLLTVGIDNIDDPTTVDVLYNFQEKAIKFRENNKPNANKLVTIFGDAYIPLIVRVSDAVSIDAYGKYEHVIIDKTITSVDEAKLRGKAELARWQDGAFEASFTTRTSGLKTGQYIEIKLPSWGVADQQFKITQITGRAYTPEAMEYQVKVAISGEVSFVDIMVMLLGKDKINVTISPDEVLLVFNVLNEDFTIIGSYNLSTKTAPYTWGTTGVNDLVYDFGTWN